VPLCLLAFLAVYYVLHLPKTEDSHWKEKLARIDFLGAFCLVIATFTLLLGLDRGSNTGWNNTITIVCISLSIPLFGLFVLVEMKWASHPFAPGHIIFERSLVASYLCNFFSLAGYMAALFYIPLFFQAVDDLSAFEAGLRMIPGIIGSVIGSVGGGLIMQKTGKYYWITVMAYFLLICGSMAVFLFSGIVVNSTVGIITGLTLCGFGGGMGVTTTLIALIANADPKDQAIATACSYLFRSLGSVIGLSISATVVQQSLRTQLRARLPDGDEADKIVERVRQSLDYINKLDPKTRDLVRACYQRATNMSFGLTVVLVSGALVSAFYIREKRLSK
jgi:Major Facilitator Superfamily